MNKVISTILLAVLMVSAVPSTSQAGLKKGQKIFKKNFRKKCKFSGVRFARHHTQGEWEDIYDNGDFPSEAQKICPRLNIDKINPSWWKHVYEFSYTYAKDGKIPKC